MRKVKRTGHIGYCGNSLGCHQAKFQPVAIASLGRKRKDYEKRLRTIWRRSLDSLVGILSYNIETGILLYRMSSETFPLAAHPRFRELWDEFIGSTELVRGSAKVREYLETGGRITVHPKRFASLGATSRSIRKKSISNLEHQSEVMDLLGLPPGHLAPVNIHLASGREGERALKRINSSIAALSETARSRLVFENEDKDFWTCQNISKHFPNFPITLDSHHHHINNGGESLVEAAAATAESWGSTLPVRHISDGAKGAADRDHHDWVREIPEEFLLKNRPSTDIEVEAKMKDLSVLYLKAKYKI